MTGTWPTTVDPLLRKVKDLRPSDSRKVHSARTLRLSIQLRMACLTADSRSMELSPAESSTIQRCQYSLLLVPAANARYLTIGDFSCPEHAEPARAISLRKGLRMITSVSSMSLVLGIYPFMFPYLPALSMKYAFNLQQMGCCCEARIRVISLETRFDILGVLMYLSYLRKSL